MWQGGQGGVVFNRKGAEDAKGSFDRMTGFLQDSQDFL